MKQLVLNTDQGVFTFHTHNSGACTLHVYPALQADGDDNGFRAAMDGVESLLLAMYSAGINLNTPEIAEAIDTAISAIENNY
jgi:hypothetical protein